MGTVLTKACAWRRRSSCAAAKKKVTYAGKVTGGKATIAIAVKDGKAVAYLCDGKKTEAWLRGTAVDGELALSGPDEATLSGSYTDGRVEWVPLSRVTELAARGELLGAGTLVALLYYMASRSADVGRQDEAGKPA